jgi:hypothetical protein
VRGERYLQQVGPGQGGQADFPRLIAFSDPDNLIQQLDAGLGENSAVWHDLHREAGLIERACLQIYAATRSADVAGAGDLGKDATTTGEPTDS